MGLGEGQGEGQGGADVGVDGGALCPGLLWAFIWFLILWFLAWPIAFIIAWLYILLLPFTACIENLKEACEALLGVVNLPLTVTENMMAMKPVFG